jgi:hypothetical protein
LFIQPALPPTRSKVLPFGCCSGTAGRFEVFFYLPDFLQVKLRQFLKD